MADVPHPLAIVAAFDVDGTLTERDCVVPFLRELVGTRRLVLAILRRPGVALVAVARRDRDSLKELAISACRGLEQSVVATAGRRFAETSASSWLRPDTVARLRWHLGEGHRVVLVSASLRSYLSPLAERLGAHAVLCTDFHVGSDGRLTGALAGVNCRGPEKAVRLRGWLAGEAVELWAYGDSSGDRELLALADRPHLVKGIVVTEVPA